MENFYKAIKETDNEEVKKVKKKVYLAGAISTDPNYREKFRKAQEKIEELGFIVLNPTCIRDDLNYDDYFPICYGMLKICNYMVVIDFSKGVYKEIKFSEEISENRNYRWQKIKVYSLTEFLQKFKEECQKKEKKQKEEVILR